MTPTRRAPPARVAIALGSNLGDRRAHLRWALLWLRLGVGTALIVLAFSEKLTNPGMAIDTLADMEDAFAGITLDKVSVSLTINGMAAPITAMYLCFGSSTMARTPPPPSISSSFFFPSTTSGLPVSRIFGLSCCEMRLSHSPCSPSSRPRMPVSIPTSRNGPASIAK